MKILLTVQDQELHNSAITKLSDFDDLYFTLSSESSRITNENNDVLISVDANRVVTSNTTTLNNDEIHALFKYETGWTLEFVHFDLDDLEHLMKGNKKFTEILRTEKHCGILDLEFKADKKVIEKINFCAFNHYAD